MPSFILRYLYRWFTAADNDCYACIQLQMTRVLTLMELQRLRRQFISFTKSHAADDTLRIADLFVQFLNNRIQ